LTLPPHRFWVKHKNMIILRLKEELVAIHNFAVAQSKEISNHVYRLNWRLEQLTGVEKVDSLRDIRLRMETHRRQQAKKKTKKDKKQLLRKKLLQKGKGS